MSIFFLDVTTLLCRIHILSKMKLNIPPIDQYFIKIIMKPNVIHPPSADLSNKCQTKVQKRLQTFLASARLKSRQLHTCLVCGRHKWRIFSRQKWRYGWQQSGVFWDFYAILLSTRQNCRNKTHNSYYYYKFYFCRQKWRSKFRVADQTKPNIQALYQ